MHKIQEVSKRKMRNYECSNNFKYEGLKPHQILVCVTSTPYYDMERMLLINDIEGLKIGEFLVLRGYHCSCYDFDETEWEGTVYKKDELLSLSSSPSKINNIFWKLVNEQIKY